MGGGGGSYGNVVEGGGGRYGNVVEGVGVIW